MRAPTASPRPGRPCRPQLPPGRGLAIANRRTAGRAHALKDVTLLVAGSAAPFLAIQALASSPAGQKLADNVAKNKKELDAAAARAASECDAAARASPFYGPTRPRWLGPLPIPDAIAAPHLDQNLLLPGNYGFDPLGLSRDAEGGLDDEKLKRYFELELLHARWAMLGALGAVVPEALTLTGVCTFPEDRWFMVGAAKMKGEDLNYFGIPGLRIAGGQGVAIIAVAQALLMSGPEIARAAGPGGLEPVGIYLGQDQNYPGGWLFDPFGLARDPQAAVRLRVAEIKHGRLAMVACIGYAAAALNGSQGPLRDVVALF